MINSALKWTESYVPRCAPRDFINCEESREALQLRNIDPLVILDAFPFTFSACNKETFIVSAKFLQKKHANWDTD